MIKFVIFKSNRKVTEIKRISLMDLPKLNLPNYPFKLKRKNSQLYVNCIIRGKDILLTPEEWVRQNMMMFLINEKGFSKNLIAIEKQLVVNDMKKRFDLLVFDISGNPLVLGEFKAPNIVINELTFKQVVNYNKVLNVPFLLVSNGLSHFFCHIDLQKGELIYFEEIPSLSTLVK